MIEFRLSVEALGRSRFAYSPLGELASSLRALWTSPAGFLLQSWRRAVEDDLPTADLALLREICPPGKFAPDFMYAWSLDPTITIEAQLQALAQTPTAQLRANLAEVCQDRPMAEPIKTLLDDGASVGQRMADALWSYWTAAIAPYWSRIRSVVEDDISYRAAQILKGGLHDLLSGLHPEVTLCGSSLLIDKPHHREGVYSQGELTLIPSVFVWPNLIVAHDNPGHFELHYAARGVGNVWRSCEEEKRGGPLSALIGRTRATILTRLSVPLTTTELARALHQSPGTVSAHLSVLRAAGLVSARRSGRTVLYSRTPLGSSIVAAAVVEQGTG